MHAHVVLGCRCSYWQLQTQGVSLLSNASTKRPRAPHGAMCLLMVLEEKCISVTLLLFLPLMLSAVYFVAHHLSYG